MVDSRLAQQCYRRLKSSVWMSIRFAGVEQSVVVVRYFSVKVHFPSTESSRIWPIYQPAVTVNWNTADSNRLPKVAAWVVRPKFWAMWSLTCRLIARSTDRLYVKGLKYTTLMWIPWCVCITWKFLNRICMSPRVICSGYSTSWSLNGD